MQFNIISMNQPFDTSLELHISFRAHTVSHCISRGATKKTQVMLLLFTINWVPILSLETDQRESISVGLSSQSVRSV